MSASQSSIGATSEHRTAEREPRKRKHLIITGASASLLLLLVVGVVAAASINGHTSTDTSDEQALHSTTKSVQVVCDSTDYKQACVSSLSRVVNASSDDPKELLKAAVAVVAEEIDKGFSNSKIAKMVKANGDPRVKGAIEDCKELYGDSKDELNRTLQSIVDHGLKGLPRRSNELRSWLSAVMSYLETCADGFPEGELKEEMRAEMRTAKELTSNALAIVHQMASFLSTAEISGFSRRLLADHPLQPDGFPSWVSGGDRRLLQEAAEGAKLTPDTTVAKDGSGNYSTISEALAAMPKVHEGRYVIYVKEGVYEEEVNVTAKMVNVTMYGDGSNKTIVTGSKNFVDGTRTFQTATFVAQGDGFMAMDMGFRNTAGAIKHQAVALRVKADRAIFLNCLMEGYQDTLYAQAHRQFYRGCVIAGTVDFIFGDASAVFQGCTVVVRRPLDNQKNTVTAQGRSDRQEISGFVIQNCSVVSDPGLDEGPSIRSYLGRPWKEYSRCVVMETEIGGFIDPDGYMPWDGDFALSTLFYAEYNNVGPGSNLTARVSWPGFRVIGREEAQGYTVTNFVDGGTWIPSTGTPVNLGFYD